MTIFGRKEDEIRFKSGDIVELLHTNDVSLAVLNDVPATIDEVWTRHKKLCDEEKPSPNNKFRLLLPSGDRDEYYYINSVWYDFDTAPYMIFKPTFKISQNVRKIFEGLYQSWKDNVDSLVNGEIEWEELREKVICKNKVRR